MHEAQAEWCLRAAPSPDPEPFEDAFDLPGEAPAAADATPPPPAPSPPTATPAIAAASSPPLLRILPIPDSPESPEPEVEPDDFSDETHLIVDGNDDPAILLISPSPPRPLGRVLATSVPPRLLSAD